jgi:16S rRNA (cytosine967-C5)-methyltransferase
MPVDLVRDAAIDVVLRVFERDVHLDRSLDKTIRRKKLSDRGRRFLTMLSYGTVRHRLLCDRVLAPICNQPLEKLPAPIWAILRMGVFQALFCNQVTFPSMVHTSVDLAKRRGHAGTARMANAILRRVPKTLEEVEFPDPEQDLPGYLEMRYSTPPWLVQRWIEEYGPEEAQALVAASCEEAGTAMRVNTLKTDATALIERFAKKEVLLEKLEVIPEALALRSSASLVRSKAFLEGQFMIQDPASMLPPHLLEPQPGDWVLDLCAAPGGKTTHIAQLTDGKARIVALDRPSHRLERLVENAERLETPGIQAICADGMRPPVAPVFDRVLVDAPCSGLGTLRRHPDLKWRMNPAAITRLAEEQRGLLRSALAACKPGGVVVFSVCTITREETMEIAQAIAAEGEAILEDGPEHLNTWKMSTGQYQILPSSGALDGFFLTRWRKAS